MNDPIPIDDRGLLLADGLFETLLADRGRLVWFEAHAARLSAGCAVLGLPPPTADRLRRAAEAAIAEAGLGAARAAVRLTWTAGSGGRGLERPAAPAPRLIAAAAEAPFSSSPASLAIATVRRNAGSPASRLKSLAYLDNVLARREARTAGADEAVMLNTHGLVACAAAANLFWMREGRLYTPDLACGVLDGIARAVVLQIAAAARVETVEARANPDALAAAEAVFLSNSLVGVRPVSRLDGRELPAHPLVDRLAQGVQERMAA